MGGGERGWRWGNSILNILVYVEYFVDESGLCIVTVGNVKVRVEPART